MPRTKFDPEKHGFAFGNSWAFEDEERKQVRELFARYLIGGGVLGAVTFGLLGALVIPLGLLGAAVFGPLGALIVAVGILVGRNQLESHLAGGYGLCGGMCFTALDFYYRGDLDMPRRKHANDQPPPRTPLRSYIWRRQMHSIVSDGLRFMVWVIFLNHVSRVWPSWRGTAWLLARSKEEWKKLRASVDAGKPVLIGLVRDTKNVFDNHQVLAIGYDDPDGASSTIYLYDPNCPEQESTIRIEFGERLLDGQESCNPSPPLRGFFCEAYAPRDPSRAVEGR
jgi:hypothetical protein